MLEELGGGGVDDDLGEAGVVGALGGVEQAGDARRFDIRSPTDPAPGSGRRQSQNAELVTELLAGRGPGVDGCGAGGEEGRGCGVERRHRG